MGSEPAVALVLETENTNEIVASAVAQRLCYALPQVHTVMDVLSNGNASSFIAYVLTFGVRRDLRCGLLMECLSLTLTLLSQAARAWSATAPVFTRRV
jgi:hypothetical protein